MNREEHLQWCKDRALAYLPHNPIEALTSMFSDLGKHPELEKHIGIELGMLMLMSGQLSNPNETSRFIEGFN